MSSPGPPGMSDLSDLSSAPGLSPSHSPGVEELEWRAMHAKIRRMCAEHNITGRDFYRIACGSEPPFGFTGSLWSNGDATKPWRSEEGRVCIDKLRRAFYVPDPLEGAVFPPQVRLSRSLKECLQKLGRPIFSVAVPWDWGGVESGEKYTVEIIEPQVEYTDEEKRELEEYMKTRNPDVAQYIEIHWIHTENL
jgi:hypothetical protein